MKHSLKYALLKSITLPLLCYVVLIGVVAYYTTARNIDEVYDAQLITAANVLFFLTQNELAEADHKISDIDISDQHLSPQDKDVFNQHADWRAFRVWYKGKLALFSDNAMQQEVGEFPSGFSDFTYENNAWRVFALSVPEDNISVEVMERQAERRHLIGGIESGLLWPFMLSLPLAALMFLRALEWGLGGLRRVTRQINTRSPELMLPLAQDHIPSDLQPLVEAVNRLLGKLSAVLDRERQLTDHAAHELRTPLSVLKLQAQMARRASNEQDRSEALDALLEGADRANHVIDQLLTLARVKNQDYPVEDTDVMQAAHESVAVLTPLLAERGMQVVFEGDGHVIARANHHLFSILFGNIINNAIKYAPAGSQIRVRGMKANGVASVSVSDEGPGIPENERDRVFERFYRMEGSVSSGSGLGLTIAGQCAAQMGAAIRLETSANGTGLCVRVEMPGT